jgi:hypothetical protein
VSGSIKKFLGVLIGCFQQKNHLDTIGCWNEKSGSAINQTVVDNRRFILMRPTLHRKNLPHRGRDSSSNSGAGFGNETSGC